MINKMILFRTLVAHYRHFSVVVYIFRDKTVLLDDLSLSGKNCSDNSSLKVLANHFLNVLKQMKSPSSTITTNKNTITMNLPKTFTNVHLENEGYDVRKVDSPQIMHFELLPRIQGMNPACQISLIT